MSKERKVFLSKVPEWAVGVLITLVIVAGYFAGGGPFKTADFKLYNFSCLLRPKKLNTPAKVIIVGIDKESIEKLGRWPWQRTQIAEAIKKLNGFGVKVIGLNLIFSESDVNPGLKVIRQLRQKIESDPVASDNKKLMEIHDSLAEAELSLDNDDALSKAIGDAKNVVLPVLFSLNKTAPVQKGKIPLYLENNSFKAPFKKSYHNAHDVLAPIDEFALKASAIGHQNMLTSSDGVVRKEPMLIYYKERFFPSLALQLALKYLDYDIRDAKSGKNLQIRELKIPVSAEVFISYNGKRRSFPYYSFSDLMNEKKLSAAQFKDRIVIIGTANTTISSPVLTPLNTKIPSVEVIANMVENILNSNYIVRPGWFVYPEILLIVIFGFFVSFAIPRIQAVMAVIITAGTFIGTIGASIFLFSHYGYWLKVSSPAALLLIGLVAVMASKRIFLTNHVEDVQTEETVETNKMLGLSFHGQGQLDMAFEKLKSCPLTDIAVKEQLYNLGLDFEKKHIFNKAIEVYEHILSSGAYRDLSEKLKRLKTSGDRTVLNPTRMDSTVIMENVEKRPALGRYQLIRELGRGAMGVVYHGKDPLINRDVAIKTLKYDEIEEDQVEDIKQRFLKEAEAAGKLSHPNIVKIYDIGDENDESFMAMELLSGGDLTRFCQHTTRLPFGEVLAIVTGVADALDYAHSNGVVHRDIKPANIMLLENKEIRVTDFGIARVMEKSKTLTGMVMGTPSYMSPEQIAGQKVDGRTDLFSLGVVFYELLTGDKPFKGDSIATLMYNITTSEPIPVNELDRRIPSCIVQIISKLLVKKPDERYQTGRDFIEDLNQCKKMIIERQRAKAASKPK